MLTPSLNTVMTRLLIVAAVLATLVLFAPAIFAQEAEDGEIIEYSENGTDPVRTFVSSDPEGAGIDWDVTGHDADSFSIDSRGVLMFNKSPNYESPGDKAYRLNDDADLCDYLNDAGVLVPDGTCGTTPETNTGRELAPNNRYDITIRATERSGETNRTLSTDKDFTVVVMDINEGGNITLDWLQPEVGTMMTATLRDVDTVADSDLNDGDDLIPTVEWEWFISAVTNPQANIEGHWTSVDPPISTTTSTYIPLGDCVDNTIANDDDSAAETRGCNGTGADNAAIKASATARDEGKYLRVKATYTDDLSEDADDERTAVAVAANPVRAEVSSDNDNVENPANGSPGFTAGGDYARSVPESTATNMPVGASVTAVDPNSDTLTYELKAVEVDLPENTPQADRDDAEAVAEHDLTRFKIDKATGQISVAKTLDYDSNPNTNNPDGKYKIMVMATDPSGENAEVEVTVTATADNDAPVIMGSLNSTQYLANEVAADDPPHDVPAASTELRVKEKDDDDEDNDGKPDYTGEPDMKVQSYLGDNNLFVASDEDARGQIFWELRGEDADDFVVSSTGIRDLTGYRGPDEPIAVRFADAPDYENPTDSNADSVYKVTLVAKDSAGAEDTRDLTVFVDNVNEAGEATLSTDQPLIGQAVTATVSDPDNNVTVVTWRWERATSTRATATWEPIPGATTGTYVPWKKSDDDADSVKDDDSMFLRAIATYIDTTSDTDKGSTGNVDERVQWDAGSDTPKAKTASTTSTGIATVTGDNPDPDPDDPNTHNTRLYRVTVTSANAVRVADLVEEDTPTFADAPYERMVAENSQTGALVGTPVMASYGDPVMYSINDIDANDNRYFEIDPYSGQIRVGSIVIPSPTPADQLAIPTDPSPVGLGSEPEDLGAAATTDPDLDYESKDTYTLLITAADREDSSKKTTATVAVKLTDQNEAPYFDKETRLKVESVEERNALGELTGGHFACTCDAADRICGEPQDGGSRTGGSRAGRSQPSLGAHGPRRR